MTTRRSQFLSAAAALILLLVFPSPRLSGQSSFDTTPTTFSGRAIVVRGTVAGVPITLVDTQPVDVGGGSLKEHLLCYPNGPDCLLGLPDLTNGALAAEVLNATVVAQGSHSRATASAAELNLNVAGQHVAATVLQARADAQCSNGTAFIRADAEIADLFINDQHIIVTGDVSQTITLPGGAFVVINEQVATMSAGNGDITVRALHIVVPSIVPGSDTDVVIAEAHADIHCGQRVCPTDKDFVTGGGRLLNPARNFAIGGGIKNGAFWGHLLYINHLTHTKAKGTDVTAYLVTGETTRHIEGLAEINGQPGSYKADVDDQGEPGVHDVIRLTLSTGETAAGTLDGGNIQLHTCK